MNHDSIFYSNIPPVGKYKQGNVISVGAGVLVSDTLTIPTKEGNVRGFSITVGHDNLSTLELQKGIITIKDNSTEFISSDTALGYAPEYRSERLRFFEVNFEQGGTLKYTVDNQSSGELILNVEWWLYNPFYPIHQRFSTTR